jgi:hypothetical protein
MRRQDDQTTAEMIAVLVAMCWVPARPTVPAKGVCDATAASVAPIPMPSAARARKSRSSDIRCFQVLAGVG